MSIFSSVIAQVTATLAAQVVTDSGEVVVHYGHSNGTIVPAHLDFYVDLTENAVSDNIDVYSWEDSTGSNVGTMSWVLKVDNTAVAIADAFKDIIEASLLLDSSTGQLSIYYTDTEPTATNELDVWVEDVTEIVYIRKDGVWLEIENSWNYWDRITDAPTLVGSGEVIVKYTGENTTPFVFAKSHSGNTVVQTTLIDASIDLKLGDKYLLQLIHDMNLVFTGKRPQVAEVAFWIEVGSAVSATEDILADVMYESVKESAASRLIAEKNVEYVSTAASEESTTVAYVDHIDIPAAVTYLAGVYQPPSNIKSASLVESTAQYKEYAVSNLEVVPIFNELMQTSVGRDSIYIRTKDTLTDFLQKEAADEVPMTQNERANILSNALTSMVTSITAQAMTAAVAIAKDNRDSNMNSTKLVEEVKMLAEQRKAVANKTVIDRALADVQIATAKTALSAAQRKYVEDAEKWAINRDMLKNQKLTSDIDYAYKESMSQADFDTKLSTLAGMEIDQAFNKSKKILMEDTRKDNIRMKAAEQYAEFLKYISAANVVPGDHHFTNLVGLITSVIAGQNLPNDAYVMLTTGDNVVSAPAVKNPV
jgi:hypothetical protein